MVCSAAILKMFQQTKSKIYGEMYNSPERPQSAQDTRFSGTPVFLFSEVSPRQKSQYGEAVTFFFDPSGFSIEPSFGPPPDRRPELRPEGYRFQ